MFFFFTFLGIFKLNVANVKNIIIEANAFQNTSFYANFSRIDNLRIEKDAFRGTSESQITVVNSHVGLLERVNAGMKEIKLQSCRIDAIKTNTFDVLSIQSIVLDNCDINVIESNFTTEKVCVSSILVDQFYKIYLQFPASKRLLGYNWLSHRDNKSECYCQ